MSKHRVHTVYIPPYTPSPARAPPMYLVQALPHAAQCTFQAQSSARRLYRRVLSQTEVLRLAYVMVVKDAKQPLCARQTGFGRR